MGAQIISLLTIVIALGSVWFLAYIVTKFFGKKSSQMIKSKYMKVVDVLSLGFDKSIYLIQVGEQYVLMHSSTKGFEFICNVDSSLISGVIANTPEDKAKANFAKYFEFFKVSNSKDDSKEKTNAVDDNVERLRNAFNNKK